MNSKENYFVFVGDRILTEGSLSEVAFTVRQYHRDKSGDNPLIFNSHSGRQTDVDMTLSDGAFTERYSLDRESDANPGDEVAQRGRGRPRIGVVGREVTLLPRQWEWLETRRGGVSAALRRLIDEARKTSGDEDRQRESQDRTHNLMMALGGNRPGFEEACRALYSNNEARFRAEIRGWPKDIVRVIRRAASDAFTENPGSGSE